MGRERGGGEIQMLFGMLFGQNKSFFDPIYICGKPRTISSDGSRIVKKFPDIAKGIREEKALQFRDDIHPLTYIIPLNQLQVRI